MLSPARAIIRILPTALRSSFAQQPTILSLGLRLSAASTSNRTRGFSASQTRFSSNATSKTKRTTVEISGKILSFDNLFLRDACACSRCVHPSTQQKLFRTTDIPELVHPESTEFLEDGSVRIVWGNDIPGPPGEEHISIYSPQFFKRYQDLRNRIRARYNDQKQVLWNKRIMEKEVKWVDYKQYMESDKALFETLKFLSSHGLVFIRGIPDSSDAVEDLAERIGNLKHTFYGKTWDVKSVKESKNIAYTSLDLGLHMDLLYFESPPGLQFLHCVRNSTIGGSSVFADSFRAANLVRSNSPVLFDTLTSFPVTFHYVNDGRHYHFTRPTVVLDQHSYLEKKRISHTNWAPPFQAPFEVDIGADGNSGFRRYVRAAKEFAQYIDEPEAQFELTLKEGECVIFQNRRVLHARRAFDPTTGDRWLKGAYIDVDAYESKLRVLSENHKFDEGAYSYIQ